MNDSFPKSLTEKLQKRAFEGTLRHLRIADDGIDFYSNDYLGFARNIQLQEETTALLKNHFSNGSTGSRLISGNSLLLEQTEKQLSKTLGNEATLLFNSGYDANLGLFSSVLQPNDVLLYDKLIHASVHDGIRLSKGTSTPFRHNDLSHLQALLEAHSGRTVFVATEAIFSMDGDVAPISEMAALCDKYKAYLIVDEAHSFGICGKQGEGEVARLGLQSRVFATVYTFGKAMGTHGAAICGSTDLRNYLINFARSFVFSTAMTPHQTAAMSASATMNIVATQQREKLQTNILHFQQLARKSRLPFFTSETPIQILATASNQQTDLLVELLTESGFLVKGIKYPTVPPKSTRMRFCVHSFNTLSEIDALFNVLNTKTWQ